MARREIKILTAGFVLAACGTADADVQREIIAVTGDAAGMTGGLFRGFGNARLNESGEVLFWARRTVNSAALNDECANALPIGVGGTIITTVGANTSPGGGCGSWSDVWFEFTDTSGAANVAVQFYLAGAEYAQAAVGIYQNNCGTLAPLGCATGTSIATVGFSDAMRTVKIRVGSNIQNQAGDGMLVARVMASPTLPVAASVTDGGLWKLGDAGVGPLVLEGSVAAFDPTLIHESAGLAAFTNWGTGFTGSVQASPLYTYTRAAVMTIENGEVGAGVIAIDPLQPPPPPVPPPTPLIPGPSGMSTDGQVALALLDGSSLSYGETTHITGTAAPGLDGLNWVNFDQPTTSRNGHVAWRSRLAGAGVTDANDVVLWKDAGAGPVAVVRAGDAAPATKPGVVFGQIGADAGIDNDGSVAFWAELSGPGITISNRSGIWSDRGGSLSNVVRAGQPSGMQDGAVFASFTRAVAMNAAGDVAFVAHVSGGSSTPAQNGGLWVYRADGSRRLVAQEGDAAPGTGEGVVFSTLSDPVLNDRGDVAFMSTLRGEGVTPQTAQALYFAGAERGLTLVARSGESVLINGQERIVKEILFGTGRPQAGHGQFNNSGSLVYELVFTDRSSALAKTDVTCPADFDGSGVVAVPDIFAYLSAWFALAPSAEWDGVPGLDTLDLFAFLQQWFGGC